MDDRWRNNKKKYHAKISQKVFLIFLIFLTPIRMRVHFFWYFDAEEEVV